MSDKSLTRAFSTKNLAPPEGASRWREYMAAAYGDLDVTPTESWSFGAINEVRVGCVGVSAVSVDGQRVVRRKSAAGAGSEDFLVVIPTKGAIAVRQGRHAELIEPGDACILNAAEHYEGWMPDASRNIAMKLPAHVLRSRIGNVDELCARADVVDREMVSIVRRFSSTLFSVADPETAERLDVACVDLLTVMFDAKPDAKSRCSSAVSDALVRDAEAQIRLHSGDSAFGVQDVAGSLGVSVRVVQKAFERKGVTFGQVLMATRLDQAHRLLKRRAASGRSIGQIAFACGFINQGHFSVRFRDRFGFSPRDVTPEG